MKNTFRDNVYVREDFLSTVKKTSCKVFGWSMENAKTQPILEIEQNWCFHWI